MRGGYLWRILTVHLKCANRHATRRSFYLLFACLGTVVYLRYSTWGPTKTKQKQRFPITTITSRYATAVEQSTAMIKWLETLTPATNSPEVIYTDSHVANYSIHKNLKNASLGKSRSVTISRDAYLSNKHHYNTQRKREKTTTRPKQQTDINRTNLPDHQRHKTITHGDSRVSITMLKKTNNVTSRVFMKATEATRDIADNFKEIDGLNTGNFFLSFQSAITKKEKTAFQVLMRTFIKVAMKKKLTYFICDGSLLGSYRHHGMIPWDDDVDLMVNSSQREDIKLAFRNHPSLVLETTYSSLRWKVYLKKYSLAIEGIPWKWPFLDLIFFKENSTHLWDIDSVYEYSVFEKSWIFPTIARPFLNAWVPAPRNTEKVLKRAFNINICLSRVYSHKFESARDLPPYTLIPCSFLYGRVPFVERHERNNSTIETLKIGEKTIHSIVLKNP